MCYTSRFLCKGLRSADKERGALHIHQTETVHKHTCRKELLFFFLHSHVPEVHSEVPIIAHFLLSTSSIFSL